MQTSWVSWFKNIWDEPFTYNECYIQGAAVGESQFFNCRTKTRVADGLPIVFGVVASTICLLVTRINHLNPHLHRMDKRQVCSLREIKLQETIGNFGVQPLSFQKSSQFSTKWCNVFNGYNLVGCQPGQINQENGLRKVSKLFDINKDQK
jgi:hypothetical protein